MGHHVSAAPAAPGQDTLTGLFELSVQAHPDAPAVSDDQMTLSYADLAARSDELAAVLGQRGVPRGGRVAVYLERGVDVFVALLGVLKAGAAYVAVDLRYPDERRDLMIRLSGASLVITAPGWSGRLRGVCDDVLEWRTADQGPAREPASDRPRLVGADTACVLFTSGSSGTPKAIALQHANLAYLATTPTLPALAPGDKFGQVSSLSFDAFHIEAWCTLAQGAEVAVLPSLADLVTLDMQRELRRRRITAMLVPTMAVNHLAHEDRQAFSALRILYTGGDVIQPAAVRTLLAGGFRRRVLQPVRAERGRDRVHGSSRQAGGRRMRRDPDRAGHGRGHHPPARRAPDRDAAAGRRAAAHRGPGRGPWLPGRTRADRRALPPRPGRRAWRAHVRHRRPGHGRRGRGDDLLRAGRQPGQDPWLPGRTRGGRTGACTASGCAGRGRVRRPATITIAG